VLSLGWPRIRQSLIISRSFEVQVVSLTNSVEHEGDESVVPCEGDEVGINKYNVLEVVDDGFSV
jgi:hypothetical protein